jgi:hypothetical protein
MVERSEVNQAKTFAVIMFAMAVVGMASWVYEARAAEDTLVEKGQIYQIVWGCLPQVGCYSEAFRVERIRPDGWLEVKQCTKDGCTDPWKINPAQATAIRPFKLGAAAD